jgi:hypothetical protein
MVLSMNIGQRPTRLLTLESGFHTIMRIAVAGTLRHSLSCFHSVTFARCVLASRARRLQYPDDRRFAFAHTEDCFYPETLDIKLHLPCPEGQLLLMD